MTHRRFLLPTLILLFTLLLTSCGLIQGAQQSETSGAPVPVNPAWDDALRQAFVQSIQGRDDVIAFLIYQVSIERFSYSADGNLALLWISLKDFETGEVIPMETGLAIGKRIRGDGAAAEDWEIIIQADKTWAKTLKSIPEELLKDELKERYVAKEQSIQKGTPFTGYKLPYPSNRVVRLTGSIGHVFIYKTCPDTCLYAFDFADGTNFPVLAAKGGTVKYAVWRYPDNYHESANYIVLEDTSTTPTTYQLYYHLAYDSIPAKFRTIGASVAQGELIAYADNTGASSGSHLHFMVHTSKNQFWGTSVDIVFDDVAVNGGRPRTCTEANQFPGYGSQCVSGDKYYSQNNGDKAPPTGGITAPIKDTKVKAQFLTVEGFGQDDTGVASMQMQVYLNGAWQPIGTPQTVSPFTTQLDLCKSNVPMGTFKIGLQVVDFAGKTSEKMQGVRSLEMKYDCTPPTPTPTITPTPVICTPGANQVAIYPNINFSGNCQTLDIGDYALLNSINPLGGDKVESITVGANVMVLAYNNVSFSGNRLVLLNSPSDISSQTGSLEWVKSFRVIERIPVPQEPALVQPSESLGHSPTVEDAITLTWLQSTGAEDYSSQLQGPDGFSSILDWQNEQVWEVGSLPEGQYRWTVSARNLVGISQKAITFNVFKAIHLPVTSVKPLPELVQTSAIMLQWSAAAGSEAIHHFEMEYTRDDANWVKWNTPILATETHLWFLGELGHTYQFRMRAVDSAGNKEEFPPTAQAFVRIAGDCTPDEFEIPDPGDDTLQGAVPLEINQLQKHNFCGYSDYDWLVFPANGGDTYRIATKPLGGNAGAAFQLYDPVGDAILGEASPSDFGEEASLEWKCPQDGVYAIRVRPLDKQLAGSDVSYEIKVDKVLQITPANFTCTALLLPLIWFVVKMLTRARTRIREQMDE